MKLEGSNPEPLAPKGAGLNIQRLFKFLGTLPTPETSVGGSSPFVPKGLVFFTWPKGFPEDVKKQILSTTRGPTVEGIKNLANLASQGKLPPTQESDSLIVLQLPPMVDVQASVGNTEENQEFPLVLHRSRTAGDGQRWIKIDMVVPNRQKIERHYQFGWVEPRRQLLWLGPENPETPTPLQLLAPLVDLGFSPHGFSYFPPKDRWDGFIPYSIADGVDLYG